MDPMIGAYPKPQKRRRENVKQCPMCSASFPWSRYMDDTFVERAKQGDSIWVCPSMCPRKGELKRDQTPSDVQKVADPSAPDAATAQEDPTQLMRAAEAARASGDLECYRGLLVRAARALV